MTGAIFTVHDVKQGSDEWFTARLGKATGSHAGDILAGSGKLGSKEMTKAPTTRRNYCMDLALERATGTRAPSWEGNAHSDRGTEREAEALSQYEVLTGELVRRTGFLQHETLLAGCSLDGDIDDFTGLVEAKCPIPAVHWETISTKAVPQRYLGQVTHAMWLTGARWVDFLSWCPEFTPNLRVQLVRCERSESAIQAYAFELYKFLKEVDELEAKVRAADEAARPVLELS